MERTRVENGGSTIRKILVSAALSCSKASYVEAMTLVCGKAKNGVEAVDCFSGVDWEAVRKAEGGWKAAYEWAARQYDAICVIPVNGDTGLSRGVYTMAAAMKRHGKPVLAFRQGKLHEVRTLAVVDAREYKGVHGRFECEARPEEVR